MKILVTGASGFIGSELFSILQFSPSFSPIGTSRKKSDKFFLSPELSSLSDWSSLLRDVNVVVHAAARAHVLNENSPNPAKLFYESNVQGTLNLAKQAIAAGVKRFIFISSIGVSGNNNTVPFTEKSKSVPWGDYAQSKCEAEEKLRLLSYETGLEVVIIRPPLVYGPNAPGNFGLMTKAISRGLPLPLANIKNKRSFVSIWNLVDLITVCLDHPKASGETFVVCDGEDVSTSEFLYRIGKASEKPARLFWMPAFILKLGSSVIRKPEIYNRLFDSLQVDASYTRNVLNWTPPLSLDDGLRRCFQ